MSAASPEESPEQKNAELQEDSPSTSMKAREVWQKITDINNKELKIDHDIYLKLFALNTPEEAFSEYDGILIDRSPRLKRGNRCAH